MSEVSFEMPQIAAIEREMAPDGVLHTIAMGLVNEPEQLNGMDEVALAILPQKNTLFARWELLHDAPGIKRDLATEHTDALYSLAEEAGLRLPTSLPDKSIASIDEDNFCVVEGGANRTAVVRGALGEAAMAMAGVDSEMPLIFIASNEHTIPVIRPVDNKANPERDIVRELAPDFLREGDVTQFDVTDAVQRQLGYIVEEQDRVDGVGLIVAYEKPGERPRIVIRPSLEDKQGTVAGLHVVHQLLDLSEYPLIIASNGQYRLKLALQAERWAREEGVTLPTKPLILGDEPGFEVEHRGQVFTTGDRDPGVYLNEFVVAYRLSRD